MTTLNAIVADVLKGYADRLEKAEDFNQALRELIKNEITAHWKIIFNGNGYGEDWVSEAKKRGLLNLRNLPEAVAEYLKPKNVKLYTETGIYTEAEMKSHYEVKLEKYCQVLNIEVGTMLEMVNKNIMPSVLGYMNSIAESVASVKNAEPSAKCGAGISLLKKLDALSETLLVKTASLSEKHAAAIANDDYMLRAKAYADSVIPAMEEVRAATDAIEPLLAEAYKPFPSYEDLLFGV